MICLSSNLIHYSTFLDHLIFRPRSSKTSAPDWASISQWLDLGAETCRPSLEDPRCRAKAPCPSNVEILDGLYSTIMELIEAQRFIALGCSDLSIAVVQRSEERMFRALIKDPQSVNEVNLTGQAPLHLAIYWPLGVEILLAKGAKTEVEDDNFDTPLMCAVAIGQVETVSSLLKAGCSLGASTLCDPPLTFAARVAYGILWEDSVTPMVNRMAILTELIDRLAAHRRELYSGLDLLTLTKTNACWARDDQILDAHLPCAEAIAKHYGIMNPIGSITLCGLRTLYHMSELNENLAEMLWEADFRDIDIPDMHGKTPLMLTGEYKDMGSMVPLACWLVKKGADIRKPAPYMDPHFEYDKDNRGLQFKYDEDVWTKSVPGLKTLHVLGGQIGKKAYRIISSHSCFGESVSVKLLQESFFQIDKDLRQFLRSILTNPLRDECLCACSAGGCRASTVMQKQLSAIFNEPELKYCVDNDDVFEELRLLVVTICLVVMLDPDTSDESSLVDEIIRFNTFQKLDLKHTCHIDFSDYQMSHDPEEVNRLRDEDAEGIELLEELMVEFREARGIQKLIKFTKGYWTRRMKEVVAKRRHVDRGKVEEMGVIWENDRSQETMRYDSADEHRSKIYMICSSDEDEDEEEWDECMG